MIFVAAVSEFDQVLAEDRSTNRLAEGQSFAALSLHHHHCLALELFQEITTHEVLRDTAVILLLNKVDLFREKVSHRAVPSLQGLQVDRGVRLEEYFPDYETFCGDHHCEASGVPVNAERCVSGSASL